jgi:tRNA A-37 threonylcarbamoyl transferase component Bud32
MQFFTYDNWQVLEKSCDAETSQQFSSLEEVFSCRGERIVKDKTSEVIKFSGSNKTFYIKRYTGPKRKYFSFFRKSVVLAEAENLISLKRIGIPVPNVVAYGERREKGHFLVGALITEEVKNSANLAQYLSSHTELVKDRKWLNPVIDQVAAHVHEMHDHKFVHRDLNLRNVLVQIQGPPVVHFIDCPAGGFRSGPLLKREIIRDLAHLDKVARYLLGTSDLLRFYKKYRKIDKLTQSDKKMIEHIRHFHDKNRVRKSQKTDKPYRAV